MPNNMRLNYQTINRIAIAISFIAILTGCGEKVPLEATNSLYDISYTGNLLLSDTIQFQSSAPAGSELLWRFSDGFVSRRTSPRRAFLTISHIGTTMIDDTVTLIVNNDIYHPNIKTFRLKPTVNLLGGNHAWKGGQFKKFGNCCPTETDHSLNDTTFNVFVVDTFNISTWAAQLPYLADSNYYSNDRTASGYYNCTRVRYTPDTIFFLQRSGDSHGWYETSYFHKY